MKINRELMKGSTSILILALLAEEEMYGYKIIQTLKARSENIFELKEGTLYPMLHALENEKAIESYWENVDNKMRKYYRITVGGRKLFESKKEEWQVYTGAINSIIQGGAYCHA
ncbi:MAG: PadR family transcriptional regulator [Syntrophomonadaceae bacterium]|jgi:PadR family transcriptional regulator PadR|nr:PadR family transcriptional regulator [Syntrophomonadaceae bacterium]